MAALSLLTATTLLIILALFSHSRAQSPDPDCKQGVKAGGACCLKRCGKCGGNGCGARGKRVNTLCCVKAIQRLKPSCSVASAPCKLSADPSPSTGGKWDIAPVSSGGLVERHEACAVMVNGLVVLLGGRGANKAVSLYNPKTRVWQNRAGPGQGVELHHMQCVAYKGKVYIVASWTGGFPFEKNNDKIYIYDVQSGRWSTKRGLPANRQRGGAACVLRKGIIYVAGGNRGGHGAHATSLGWLDAYDIGKDKWTTNLPGFPAARDHTGGALVKDMLCVAGGRDGGSANFFNQNEESTWCYRFGARKWTRMANMPVPRGGSSYGKTCSGNLIVAGGEGNGQAYTRVDEFDGKSWKTATNLRDSRHGSGVATSDCSCGHMFIPSGSGNQGGRPELTTTERFIPNGKPKTCGKY